MMRPVVDLWLIPTSLPASRCSTRNESCIGSLAAMAKIPELLSRSCVSVILVAAALALDAGRREASAQASGTILMSTSGDTQCGVATVIYVMAIGRAWNPFRTHEGSARINHVLDKSAFPNYWGHVWAFTVEPGDYYFSVGTVSPNFHYPKPRLSDIRIAAGDVKYVGDVHVQGCGRKIGLTVADRWGQVRSKFVETYPNVNLRAMKIELIKIPPGAAN